MFTMQQTQLDVEHVFLALLHRRDGVPAQIITWLGGNVGSIIQQLEDALHKLPLPSRTQGSPQQYISLRCNQVLQKSAEEADRLQSEVISVEHMLLAIAEVGGGVSGRLLKEEHIDKEKILAILPEVRKQFPDEDYSDLHGHKPYKRTVNPPTLVEPRGYNHGILATGGRTLYLAGQTALDGEGKIVAPGSIVEQYRQVLNNLKAVVEAAGGEMRDIVSTTIYVRFMDDYKAHLKELGKVHKEYFGSYYPATALIGVARLFDDDALLEVTGIAVIS